MIHAFVHRSVFLRALFLVVSPAVLQGAHSDNTIYSDLIQNGVPMPNGQNVKFDEPLMADGLNAEAQLNVISGIVPAIKLKSFLGGGRNDLVEWKISDVATGRRLDVYFIANGNLAVVANRNFIQQMVGANVLTTVQVQARGLDLIQNQNVKECFAHFNFPLFNLVQVSATCHGLQTQADGSELIAFMLDSRFNNDMNFPNEWATLRLGRAGLGIAGPPQLYEGVGGYAKFTAMQGPTPQVFVEYHLFFNEPFGWFNGKPVIQAKLPDKLRSDIRLIRSDFTKLAGLLAVPAGNGVPAGIQNPNPGGKQPADAAAQPMTEKK